MAYLLLLGFWANSLGRIAYAQLHAQGRPDIPARAHLAELVPYAITLLLALAAFGVPGAALAWTLRCAIDAAVLIRLSRAGPAVGPALMNGLVLVIATATCLAIPLEDWRRWAVLASMLLFQAVHALRSPPARIGPLLASVAGKLRFPRWFASRLGST